MPSIFSCTVDPLTNDHPHQRPSLLYDNISCDGQCFLFVRSLTNDHPSNATNDRVRWDFLPRERPLRVGLQCISKTRGWRFNIRFRGGLLQWCAQTPLKLFNCLELSFILATLQRRSQIYVGPLRRIVTMLPARRRSDTFVVIQVLWTRRIRVAVIINGNATYRFM